LEEAQFEDDNVPCCEDILKECLTPDWMLKDNFNANVVSWDAEEWVALNRPSAITKHSFVHTVDLIRATSYYADQIKWMLQLLEAQGLFVGASNILRPGCKQQIEHIVNGLPENIRPKTATGDVAKEIGQLQFFQADKDYYSLCLSPHGLGEVKMILDGTMLYAGVSVASIGQGNNINEKMEFLKQMNGPDFLKYCGVNGMCFVAETNAIVLIPSGFLTMEMSQMQLMDE
jgi:hypothetical protein